MNAQPQLLPAGSTALVAEYETLSDVLGIFRTLVVTRPPGIVDIVPAARTILVRWTAATTLAKVSQWIRSAVPTSDESQQAERIVIDVLYDGADLDEVAAIVGLSREGVIALHASTDYLVAFTGFAPGFGYLTSDDRGLDVPRRDSPRPRVAAGSVGLAGEFSGVYPRATPGGWQLIGRTNAVLFDDQRAEPALLRPGMSVQFRAVRELVRARETAPKPSAAADVRVLASGPQLTVQDLGRPGYAADGVTASGAMDRTSHRAANHAVGNADNAATLEIAFGGAALAFDATAVIAVAGAPTEVTLESPDGEQSAVEAGTPTLVWAGSVLTVGFAPAGTRSYLAVRGGWNVQRAVGSRSTDTLSGLGPEVIRPGDTLAIAPTPTHANAVTQVDGSPTLVVAPGETATLDIVLGPRSEWFTAEALETLVTQPFEVSGLSDRVGARLTGATPLHRSILDELPSEGVVRGAIQVPANGQPVLFLADHPVTGGYPVIATLTRDALDRAGQLPPGAFVRFRIVEAG